MTAQGTTSTDRLMVIGWDGVDPDLARSLAAEGAMPNFARYLKAGSRAEVKPPPGEFVAAFWPSFATGQKPDRHGYSSWHGIDFESYRHRAYSYPRLELFWRHLTDRGHRVAIVDLPNLAIHPEDQELQISQWGTHDLDGGFATWPRDLAPHFIARYGPHPISGLKFPFDWQFAPDDYAFRAGTYRTLEEDRQLLDELMRGVAIKTRLTADLFREGGHHLLISSFGEGHAAGHQFWHYVDATHERHDKAALQTLGHNPLREVYRALDRSLGELVAGLGEQDCLLLLIGLGMGPHHGGERLLNEMLRRIDDFDEGRQGGWARRLWARLPLQIQLSLARALRPILLKRPRGPTDPMPPPDILARQAFFHEPLSAAVGGIRLNLLGREPQGHLRPTETARRTRQLAKDLAAFINLDQGAGVVASCRALPGRQPRAGKRARADYFVEWNRRHLIERAWSAKTGGIEVPYDFVRSGDHNGKTLLLALGPGLAADVERPAIFVEDIAPSICRRFGENLTSSDGAVIGWLCGNGR